MCLVYWMLSIINCKATLNLMNKTFWCISESRMFDLWTFINAFLAQLWLLPASVHYSLSNISVSEQPCTWAFFLWIIYSHRYHEYSLRRTGVDEPPSFEGTLHNVSSYSERPLTVILIHLELNSTQIQIRIKWNEGVEDRHQANSELNTERNVFIIDLTCLV